MRGDRRRTGLFAHAGACVTDAPDIHSASELPDRQALSVWCDHSVYEWWKEGPAQGRCMVDLGSGYALLVLAVRLWQKRKKRKGGCTAPIA